MPVYNQVEDPVRLNYNEGDARSYSDNCTCGHSRASHLKDTTSFNLDSIAECSKCGQKEVKGADGETYAVDICSHFKGAE